MSLVYIHFHNSSFVPNLAWPNQNRIPLRTVKLQLPREEFCIPCTPDSPLNTAGNSNTGNRAVTAEEQYSGGTPRVEDG